MKKVKRLQVLLNLAELKEQEALKSLAEAQKLKNAEHDKLNQLMNFKDQYLKASLESEQRGVSVTRFVENRNFMAKINEAIEEQLKRTRTTDSRIQNRHGEWIKARQTRLKFETLIQNERQHQSRLLEKQIQNEIDNRPFRKS